MEYFMRKLVYFVAVSIDGFIADLAGDFSRFPVHPETLANLFARYPETCPAHLREVLGVTGRPRRFDTVLLGRRSHAPALEAGLTDGAYSHLRQIVVTHQDLPESPQVELMGGDIAPRIAELKAEPGLDIWLCGGGELAAQLVDLIDEIQLKINPVLLGSGIPLFGDGIQPRSLQATNIEQLPGGITLATYRNAIEQSH
ncbi:dihydrofolate reductase family protein [Salinibacterium sp. G-O1]|uniref:dihydrofolate reductase family protein n=1 Tax=Salinibacterium sp. G-O1 TaxID=3046208 RepID=UPI0024B91409|nr:dihydrofolate reductase family protein [Salinibacterium sp. G-O1]MDJ0336576.1 dihydrofolate reductase family protein [Salinibacterium sp. G-O1]